MAENLDFDPPAAEASIGARLRAARKNRGINLDDVAAQTRIPVRHLEHIENDQWDSLPSITYSVGFTRAFANAVGLNGSGIGAELRELLGGRSSETNAAIYQPADPSRVPPRSLALIAAVIAIALVAGYLIWRNNAVGDDVDEVIAEGQAVPTIPAASAPAPNPAPQQPAAPATGPVVLTATDAVWLRVYDSGDRTLFQGEMKAGDRFEVPATAQRPQIRTGRPNALRVTVGQAVIPPLGEPEQTISNVSLLASDLAGRLTPAAGPQPGFTPVPAAPAAR